MKVGIFSYYDIYNIENAIFDKNKYPIGENLEYPFVLLKEELSKKNFEIDTLDKRPLEDFDSFIFLDFPSNNIPLLEKLKKLNKSLNLIIFECEIIKKNNWDKKNHIYFDKVFTWNPELVDSKKYIRFFWPNMVPNDLSFDLLKKEKLCTIISGNKINSDRRELYSERLKAIKWYEKNHLNDFDLYGSGWERGVFLDIFNPFLRNKFAFKVLNKLDRDQYWPFLLKKKAPSYRGKVSSKREVLERYKFSICYENAKNISGYITEKIFDCFFASCVPIYFGDSNISQYVPKNCFINYSDFSDIKELHNFIANMNDFEYKLYIENIRKFVLNEELSVFNARKFVEIIINNMSYAK